MAELDPDAEFVSLLTEHQLALRLYVRSLLPGDPAVADVTQQANSTIWKKRRDFEAGTNFKAWIFSIARFEVLNFRKREVRDSRLVFSDEMEDFMAAEMPQYSEGIEDRQLALKMCLEKLRPADRELIQQRYFKRESLVDFAAAAGRSVGGLRVSLHRVRAALAKCIESTLAERRVS